MQISLHLKDYSYMPQAYLIERKHDSNKEYCIKWEKYMPESLCGGTINY